MSLNVISGKLARAQRVVIYGQEGVGKSTLAAGFPCPIFLDTEAGSHHLDVDRVPIERLSDLTQALNELAGMAAQGTCQWQTIVIDTADNLWELCAKETIEEHNWSSIEAPGFGVGYAIASGKFNRVIAWLDDFMKMGIHVVCVCHADVKQEDPPEGTPFNKYIIKVNAPAAKAETARKFLKEHCDVLCFCRFDIDVRRDKDKNKPGKAINARRVLHTDSSPTWEAKNRSGIELPDGAPMEASALAPLWSGAPRTNPAGNATPQAPALTPQADPEAWVWSEDDRALLTEYFVGIGELTEGQTLAELRPALQGALKARAKKAIEKAQAWKNEQEAKEGGAA